MSRFFWKYGLLFSVGTGIVAVITDKRNKYMNQNQLHKWNATAAYAMLQIANWSFYAVILAFSSNVLRDRGFTDGQISIFLGIATAASFIAQLGIGELISRSERIRTWAVMLLLGGVMAASSLAAALPGLPNGMAVGAFGISCMVLQLLPALTNGIGMDAIRRGSPTNYSLARGMGSLGYSSAAYAVGVMVRKYSSTVIPVAGAVCGIGFAVAVVWYHFAGEAGLAPSARERGTEQKQGNFLRKYPRFALFLLAAVILQISHNLPSNFMFQIMLDKNGTAEHQGIATAICALVELPVMFGFPWMLRRLKCDRWVRIGSVCMVLKGLLIFFADSPEGVYLAQMTQMVGYGLYVMSSVNYAELVVDKGESVRAQSYLGATTTVGSLIASSIGGLICQHFGVQTMVLVCVVTALIGGVIIACIAQKTEK